MRNKFFQKAITAFFCAVMLSHASVSKAHDAGAIMDPNGTVAAFTGYALVTCSNDGNGDADNLTASIKDTSAPQRDPSQGDLLVNLQIIKGNHAISTTDPVPGDGNFSPEVKVHGGNGVYQLLVNKTKAGARSFIISYHCMTASNDHTGTDISVVYQFE